MSEIVKKIFYSLFYSFSKLSSTTYELARLAVFKCWVPEMKHYCVSYSNSVHGGNVNYLGFRDNLLIIGKTETWVFREIITFMIIW